MRLRRIYLPGDVVYGRSVFSDMDPILKEYRYRVAAVSGSYEGALSPPLLFQLNGSFCGDGVVDDGEECDDGHTRDGDGCSSYCEIEPKFACKGGPKFGMPNFCIWGRP